jgi:hypothetical protein
MTQRVRGSAAYLQNVRTALLQRICTHVTQTGGRACINMAGVYITFLVLFFRFKACFLRIMCS